jgi:hypothetical protein
MSVTIPEPVRPVTGLQQKLIFVPISLRYKIHPSAPSGDGFKRPRRGPEVAMANIDAQSNLVELNAATGPRRLVLVQGNGARRAERLLADMGEMATRLSALGAGQAELGQGAQLLSADVRAISRQIEHCLALWRDLRDAEDAALHQS